MVRNPLFEFRQPAGEFSTFRQEPADLDERANDENADLHRALRVQHASSHDRTVLGERIGERLRELQARQVVAICDHLQLFRVGKLEQEITRKPATIALDLLVETLGADALEPREIGVNDHTLSTDQQDAPFDCTDFDKSGLCGHSCGSELVAFCDHLTLSIVACSPNDSRSPASGARRCAADYADIIRPPNAGITTTDCTKPNAGRRRSTGAARC